MKIKKSVSSGSRTSRIFRYKKMSFKVRNDFKMCEKLEFILKLISSIILKLISEMTKVGDVVNAVCAIF